MRSPYGNASLPRQSRSFIFLQKQYTCKDCGYEGEGPANQERCPTCAPAFERMRRALYQAKMRAKRKAGRGV